jgi:hypothetical protein
LLSGQNRAASVAEFRTGTINRCASVTTDRKKRAAFVTEAGLFSIFVLALGTLHVRVPFSDKSASKRLSAENRLTRSLNHFWQSVKPASEIAGAN